MCPVRRTECVAYIQISQISQLFAEFFAVLGLFLAAKTGILKQNYIPFLHGFHSIGCSLTGYVVVSNEHNLFTQFLGQSLCNGSQRLAFVGTILYFAQVGAQNHLAAVVNQLLNRGHCSHNTCLVRNLAVLQRNVKVTSYQNSLTLCIDVIYGFLIQAHFYRTSILHNKFDIHSFIEKGARSIRPDPLRPCGYSYTLMPAR